MNSYLKDFKDFCTVQLIQRIVSFKPFPSQDIKIKMDYLEFNFIIIIERKAATKCNYSNFNDSLSPPPTLLDVWSYFPCSIGVPFERFPFRSMEVTWQCTSLLQAICNMLYWVDLTRSLIWTPKMICLYMAEGSNYPMVNRKIGFMPFPKASVWSESSLN